MSDLTPEQIAEEERLGEEALRREEEDAATIAEVEAITADPAFDDPDLDDDGFVRAALPMFRLGRTDRYRRNFRRFIVMPFWQDFTAKAGDRLERLRGRALELMGQA